MGDRLGFGTKGRRQGGEGDAVLAQVGRGRIREEDSDGRECHKIIFAGPEDGPLQSFTGPWLGVPIPDARRAGSRGSPFGSLQGYNYNLNPPTPRPPLPPSATGRAPPPLPSPATSIARVWLQCLEFCIFTSASAGTSMLYLMGRMGGWAEWACRGLPIAGRLRRWGLIRNHDKVRVFSSRLRSLEVDLLFLTIRDGSR